MKIAVVGAGISGLGAAYALHREHDVTLYEAERRLGGHANTVDVTLDHITFPVDTGFLVYNERTYPQLIRLFAELGVATSKSDMSFGISVRLANGRTLEWAGTSIDTLFAQRRNLFSPRFIAMLRDLLRFNRHATRIALGAHAHEDDGSLGAFLDQHRYGTAFRDWYLLPMAAAIWSCPIATMLDYPIATFARFCHNHGLLQVNDRPQWYTVRGGAREYVQKIAGVLNDVRIDAVVAVEREASSGQVMVKSRQGMQRYDHVILACHSDQSLAVLKDADADERAVLAAVRYQSNRAWLHTDLRLMPAQRKVWSSWNYLSDATSARAGGVSVTYLLNKLQPLPCSTPLLLSLNPLIAPTGVIAEIEYSHPVFDRRAIAAQRRLPDVQGRRQVWFAGAWTGYGFHEDGLGSGLAVAAAIKRLGTGSSRLAA